MASFPKLIVLALAVLPAAVWAQDPDEIPPQAGGERHLSKDQEKQKYMLPAVQGMSAKQRIAAWDQRLKMLTDSPFGGVKWRSVGPSTQSGRVIAIHAPSSDPKQVFVAFATGGLYRTTDDGITWDSLFDNQSAYAIGDFAVSKDGKTIWVGTGENNSQRTSYSGTGVFKSTDAGKTWTNMGLEETHRIGAVLIDPKDEKTVWVAAVGALYSQNPNRGIYKTTDGGKTWQWILKIDEYTGAIDLAMDPRNSNVVYASTWDRDRRAWNFREGGPGSAIYKTTDGGKSWNKLTNGLPKYGELGRIGLAVAPSKPDTVYAFMDNQAPEEPGFDERIPSGALTVQRFLTLEEDVFVQVDPKVLDAFFESYLPSDAKAADVVQKVKDKKMTMEDIGKLMQKRNPNVFDFGLMNAQVYRSDDAGKTWKKAHQMRIGEHGGYYGGKVFVNPSNPNDICITGVGLLRSHTGGATWEEVADGNHADQHAYWFDPTNPKRQYDGTDGGLYISGDDGETWRHIENLNVGQFTTLAVDNKIPYNIYGGLQDNGTMKGTTRGIWTTIGGGDGSAVAIDPRDTDDVVYVASQFGAHNAINQKTNDRWSARAQGQRGEVLRYNWVSPIIVSPFHPDIVYLGANRLFRSMNKGRSYVAISPDLTKNLPDGDVPYSTIKDVSESPLQFGLIYVGCDDGNVKMTPDGGVQWVDIPTPQPKKWVSRIIASRYDKATVYCSQSGYREDDWSAYLWKSTDYGKTWKSIVNNLPAETVNVIREDPNQENILYVGTDMGVYVSFNKGDSWEALAGGLMTTPVHDIAIQARDQELVIGTHARSVWVLPLTWVYDISPELRNTDIKLWPMDSMRRDRTWGYRGALWDTADQKVPDLKITFWTKHAGKATIRLKDKDGKVVKEMSVDALTGYNFANFGLLLTPGKMYSTTPTKPKTGAEAVKDPREAERPKYVEAGEYTVEVTVGDKTTTGTWRLN